MYEIIAMITMVIDHLGYVFFPNELWMRAIGRLAFPLYAWGIAMGYKRTKNIKRYFIRLFWIALISQIPYSYLFETKELDVVFTLLFSLLGILALDRVKNILMKVFLFSLVCVISAIVPMDYGPYCVLLVAVYCFLKPTFYPHGHIIASLWVMVTTYVEWWEIQLFSLISDVLILLNGKMPSIKVNRTFYRIFYPGHLAILALVKHFL